MFRVPTYLGPSRIHGTGVFTSVPIEAGTVIWELTPEIDWELTEEELDSFPEPFRTRLTHYCYLDESGKYILCGDNAKFMNHSEEPNCDDSGQYTRAHRDIAAGEELTCDYRQFDMLSRDGGLTDFRAVESTAA